MSLLNNKIRAAAVVAAVYVLIFSSGLTASAFGFQSETLASVAPYNLKPYAGTWHWMFQGKPFVTIVLVPTGDHFTGTMTNGRFDSDGDGNMTAAAAEPGTSEVTSSFFKGKILHVIVTDPRDKSTNDFTMTLTTPGSADFNSGEPDAPKNLKSWPAERVSDDTAPPENKSEIYHVGGDVIPPKIIYSLEPSFPPGHDKDPGGICLITFVADVAGIPQDVRIKRGLTPNFDRSAIDAVKQYKFQPATFKGKPVPVQMSIRVQFQTLVAKQQKWPSSRGAISPNYRDNYLVKIVGSSRRWRSNPFAAASSAISSTFSSSVRFAA